MYIIIALISILGQSLPLGMLSVSFLKSSEFFIHLKSGPNLGCLGFLEIPLCVNNNNIRKTTNLLAIVMGGWKNKMHFLVPCRLSNIGLFGEILVTVSQST